VIERLSAAELPIPRAVSIAFGLLGHAVALKAGVSNEALVRQRILAPLGMNSTAITLGTRRRSGSRRGTTHRYGRPAIGISRRPRPPTWS
jgi:CubicO group peptidase (beta-lactamase class C family)